MAVSDRGILLLSQRLDLNRSLEAAIRLQADLNVVGLLWDQTAAHPDHFRRSLEESALVVAELFRESRLGIWAGGARLAERYLHRVPFLIVAPRHWADEIQVPGYWDVASPDSVGERVHLLLANPDLAWENFERIKAKVAHCWNEPEGH